MTFQVGQKVVCVDDSKWSGFVRLVWNYPTKGSVYTIRELTTLSDGRPGVRLEEITNPVGTSADGTMFCEPMFSAARFRPVAERKTNISIFTEMLTDEKV